MRLLAHLSVVAVLALAARAQDTLLFTADVDGQFAATSPRPGAPSEGGAARLATALARARGEGAVCIDAGNLLGDVRTVRDAASLATLLRALPHDARNVSFRDFRAGKAATLAALTQGGAPAISCTLQDHDSGALLFPAFTVVSRGERKLALLGATALPAALAELPHLRAQLAGVRVAPLIDAVRAALPQARAAADTVAIVFYGSASDAQRLRASFAAEVQAIVAGNVPQDWLARGEGAPLLGCITPAALHRADLRSATVTPMALGADLTADETIATLVATLREEPPAGAARAPDRLPPGSTVSLDASGENRGMRLQVHSAALLAEHGARRAPAGRRLLVLDASVENIIPLTLVQERQVPTEYRLPKLGDHLYVVASGRWLGRLAVTADDNDAAVAAGHLPVVDLHLPRIGARRRGTLVFDVPEVAATDLSLRCYDYAHGHITLQLIGEATPIAKPRSDAPRNEVVELAAYGIDKRGEFGGQTAGDGQTWVVVDLRARSTFTIDADATAFDPKAKAGQRLSVGHVADWTDAPRYLQLVIDGVYGAGAPVLDRDGGLGLAPRFLPDLATGGLVAFLAPKDTQSLELRCDFPNAKSSLDGKLMRPRGMTLALEGKRPELGEATTIAEVRDSQFAVRLLAQRDLPAPDAGRSAVALDFEVANLGKDGEFFQPIGQLQLATADGKLWPADATRTAAAVHPAGETLWVPPGERRRGTLAYVFGGPAARLRVAYASVDAGGARMLTLPAAGAVAGPIAEPKDTPAPVSKPEVKPPEQPAQPTKVQPAKVQPAEVQPAPPTPTEPTTKPSKPTAPELTAAILTPPGPAKGLAGVGLKPEQINTAIDRGADFLWAFLRDKDAKQGRPFGSIEEHKLVALALVHADAHKKKPDFDRELRAWLTRASLERLDMYSHALVAMLVDAHGDPAFAELQRRAVRVMLETQGPKGGWTYSRTIPDEFITEPTPTLRVSGGIPLDMPPPPPLTRRSPWEQGVDGDNSVSQYAILGLDASMRSGNPIDAEVWRRAVANYRAAQCDDGGWAYFGKSYIGYGSMTCAGICSLAIALHHLGHDPRQDPAIWRGVQWLDKNFSPQGHPGRTNPGEWFYYYLYAVERVGRVLGLDYIGKHEWYPLGAKSLLDRQRPDGGWKGVLREDDERLATSFALLFLTRATPTLIEQKLARGGTGTLKTGARVPPGGRYYVILDGSGSMLEQRDGQSKWQIARDAVGKLVAELPDDSHVALRVYGHRKTALAPDASEDTELVIPMARLDKAKFATTLQALRARGKTPLARSLQAAAKDLGGAQAQNPVTLVLLTDGGEDSMPRQDPVAAAAAFATRKDAIRFHLIGFDIGRDDWLKQLRAMADASSGTYWPAARAEQLAISLRCSVLGVPESFVVQDAQGQERGRAAFGASMELPEGRYTLRTQWAGQSAATEFWINTGRVTGVTFDVLTLLGK